MKKTLVLVLEANNADDLLAVERAVDAALDGALSFRDSPENARIVTGNPLLCEDHDAGPFLLAVPDPVLANIRELVATQDEDKDRAVLEALFERSTEAPTLHWSFEAWTVFDPTSGS